MMLHQNTKEIEMIAAYFTKGGKNKLDTLDVVRLTNGDREWIETMSVMGKREARKVAESMGAKPWNF